MNTDIHVKSDPLPITPVKQYTQFKVGACFFIGENFIAHSYCEGCGKCSFEFFFKGVFWSVLVYILIIFCLKNVHCLPMK